MRSQPFGHLYRSQAISAIIADHHERFAHTSRPRGHRRRIAPAKLYAVGVRRADRRRRFSGKSPCTPPAPIRATARTIAERELQLNTLQPGERVLRMVSVFKRPAISYFRATRGLLVLTNQRLLYLGLEPRDLLAAPDLPPTFEERDFPVDTTGAGDRRPHVLRHRARRRHPHAERNAAPRRALGGVAERERVDRDDGRAPRARRRDERPAASLSRQGRRRAHARRKPRGTSRNTTSCAAATRSAASRRSGTRRRTSCAPGTTCRTTCIRIGESLIVRPAL